MGAGALGRADDRAEVVAVGDLVADDQEGVLPALRRPVQQILDREVLPHRAHGNHALVRVGHAHAVQLAPVALHHRDSLFPGNGGDEAQRPVSLAAGDKNLVDGPVRSQRFRDGVPPFDQFVFDSLFVFHPALRKTAKQQNIRM